MLICDKLVVQLEEMGDGVGQLRNLGEGCW
jgi:hypothetical protein